MARSNLDKVYSYLLIHPGSTYKDLSSIIPLDAMARNSISSELSSLAAYGFADEEKKSPEGGGNIITHYWPVDKSGISPSEWLKRNRNRLGEASTKERCIMAAFSEIDSLNSWREKVILLHPELAEVPVKDRITVAAENHAARILSDPKEIRRREIEQQMAELQKSLAEL